MQGPGFDVQNGLYHAQEEDGAAGWLTGAGG
jgi:hypothetical protein